MSLSQGPRLVKETEHALDAVRLAADRVAAAYKSEIDDVDPAEVSALLGSISTAVSGLLHGRLSPLDSRLVSDLGHRLLESLRKDLVRLWSRSERLPSAREVIDVWRALEEVRQAMEPGLPDDLSRRFSGRDGLNLVVEMAHDLRSPLTSILSLAEILHSGQSGQVNDTQRHQLGLVYEAALQLSALASDVLELVRGGNGLADDRPSPFSIAEVIDSVHEMVHPIAEKRDLTVKLIKPPRDHRYGHPQALSRVLLNLTTNALKFTDKGFVEIAARARGLTSVEFSVRDTGTGIPREALNSLYEPFRRVPDGKGYTFSGTGLGLAICRKLARAMGSELRVVTGAWGTQFAFELDLPLADLSTGQPKRSRWAAFASLTNPRRLSRKWMAVAASILVLAAAATFLTKYQPTFIPRSPVAGQPLAETAGERPEFSSVAAANAAETTVEQSGSEPATQPGAGVGDPETRSEPRPVGLAAERAARSIPGVSRGDGVTTALDRAEQSANLGSTSDATPDAERQPLEPQRAGPTRVTPPVALTPGRLYVNATPWGVLSIDGEVIGNTPRADVEIAAGTHLIRVTQDGFEPYERQVEIAPGQELRITNIVLRRLQP